MYCILYYEYVGDTNYHTMEVRHMSIKRDAILVPGTRICGRYKGKEYLATIVQYQGAAYIHCDDAPLSTTGSVEVGGQRYFKSLSGAAAGVAGLGRNGPSGWDFWSISSEPDRSPSAPQTAPAPPPAPSKGFKAISRMKPSMQVRLEDGQVRYWCSSCCDAFFFPEGSLPEQCPEGHEATTKADF